MEAKMKVNMYAGVSREERKVIDRELRARMMPKMIYPTRMIVPHKNELGIVSNVPVPANIDPHTGKTAPYSGK